MSDTDEFQIVDSIPPAVRGGHGGERSSKLRRFYNFAKDNEGKAILFSTGAKSPQYGGDKAKARFPGLKMSARRNGEGPDGKPRYDIYGTYEGSDSLV